MLNRVCSLVVLALGTVAFAADPPAVTVVPRPAPAKWTELKVPAKQLVTLTAGAKAGKWVLIDADGADLVGNGATATFTASLPGRYRVIATVDGAEPLLTVLVVGDAPEPNPPGPKPKPDTALAKRLRDAFDADADPKKSDRVKDLAALYRQAAGLAESQDVPTSGELLRRVRDAGTTLIGPDSLTAIRKAVAAELAMIVVEDAPLTDEQRKGVAKVFREIAAVLEGF